MKYKTTIEVEFNDRPENVELFIDYIIENDGIGSYEYWGFKGYDKGENYVTIENIEWDKNKYNEQENDLIHFELNKELVITHLEKRIEDYQFNHY